MQKPIISLDSLTKKRMAQNILDGLTGERVDASISPIETIATRGGPLLYSFASRIGATAMANTNAPVTTVAKLLSALGDKTLRIQANEPQRFHVEGIFFPSHLLYDGWWNRPMEDRVSEPDDWQYEEDEIFHVRQWLNTGYELWGPSWDLFDPSDDEQYLYGQIGQGDEANSLPIIIAPKKARKILNAMDDALAVSVRVSGTLHYGGENTNGLSSKAKKALALLAKAAGTHLSHFLLVEDDAYENGDSDTVERLETYDPIYSAYLWQCLVKEDDLSLFRQGNLAPSRAIFLWEHTNLLSHDCVKFNYAGLRAKKDYLEKEMGKLVVLQHSFSIDRVMAGVEEPHFSQRDLGSVIGMARQAVADDSNVINLDDHRPED